jgi:Dolichyl-phosphate-mannose-protein mannosyltransferase
MIMGLVPKKITHQMVALAIILFFVVDRIICLGFLLPEFCVEDERWIMEGSAKMVHDLDIDPGTHKYPGLMFYLTSGVYGASYAGSNLKALPSFESPASFYHHIKNYNFSFVEMIKLGRLLVCAIGALGLWLFFVFVRKYFNETTSVIAMFFMMAAPAYLFSTGLLKNDALLTVCVLLVMFASMKVYTRGRMADYVLCGAAIGLCMASKYSYISAVPMLFAHRLHHKDLSLKEAIFKWRWTIPLLAAIPVFFIFSPFTFLDSPGAIKQAGIEWAIQNNFNPLLRRSSELWWHAPVFFQFSSVLPLALGVPLYLLSLLGLYKTLKIKDPKIIIIISYPAAHILHMIFMSELGVPHLYTSVVPFFALFAAMAISSYLKSENKAVRLGVIIIAAAIVFYNVYLFHKFIKVEDYILRASVTEMEKTHQPGERDIAFVPYFPSPDINWNIEFMPQFFLSKYIISENAPDRVLIHHAYYSSYGDNTKLAANKNVAKMLETYYEMRMGRQNWREIDRWVYMPGFGIYGSMWPDLDGLRSSIYVKKTPEKTKSDKTVDN